MTGLVCRTCGASFSVDGRVQTRFPGWVPKRCLPCHARKSRRRQARKLSKARRKARRRGLVPRGLSDPQSGIFTDGSCAGLSARRTRGPGSWAVIWVAEGEILDVVTGTARATTPRAMELTAVLRALELVPPGCRETLYTDSTECVHLLEERAEKWAEQGWEPAGKPVPDLELVREAWVLRAARPHLSIRHIKGHAGFRWNEAAHVLARSARRRRRFLQG